MTSKDSGAIPIMEKTTRMEQLDLFSVFHGENTKDLSNSMPVWDFYPKYFLSYKKQASLRNKSGGAEPYSLDFYIRDARYKITIKPTMVKGKNGKFISYFPGPSEEILEEVLKKLATLQNHGRSKVDGNNVSTWVFFTYNEIRKELKSMGHERDITDIKRSLEILSDCRLKIESYAEDGGIEYHDSIIPTMMLTSRKDYLNKTVDQNAVMLSPLITASILNGDYFQFNYYRYNKIKPGLGRWIYRLLCHRWRNAKCKEMLTDNRGLKYDLTESATRRQSGFLLAETLGHRRAKIIEALNEIKAADVISNFEINSKKDKTGKIVDYNFTLKPTEIFVNEQVQSNIRLKKITKAKLIQA